MLHLHSGIKQKNKRTSTLVSFPSRVSDFVAGGSKPATLETGAVVTVPLFVERGQEILVDTRSGQYMSRAQN